MIALHARRSHDSIARWYQMRGSHGLMVILTGTDLYRDIRDDSHAKLSLQMAQRLIVLQSAGLDELTHSQRAKTSVIYQSTTKRKTLVKTSRHLRAVMVGHLRTEKSPETLFEAAKLLTKHKNIFIQHIGAGLDSGLADSARSTATLCRNYKWLGALGHSQTRTLIQRAHVLIHASTMEGGAHTIMEAIRSGVPVIASQIPGNVGMLGNDYSGYFPVGAANRLADTLLRCRESTDLLDELKLQCARRESLFDPDTERSNLIDAIEKLS